VKDDNGNMKKIKLDAENIETGLHNLEKLLGIKSLSIKYEPLVVFDINHLSIQSGVLFLDYLYEQIKTIPAVTFKREFRNRLKSFPKFFNSEKYEEYLEKCASVILLHQLIVGWHDIKDEQGVNGKKLDLAFIRDSDAVYVEISKITINFYLQLLQRYNQHYFYKLDPRKYTAIPLYYEVVFTEKPTEETLQLITAKLEYLMKQNTFPVTVDVNESCEIYVDELEARLKEKQLIREKLNDMSYLKSTTLNSGGGQTYTLAYRFDFKSIENKIAEEAKHHSLEALDNVWIALHVPIELLNELEDKNREEDLCAYNSKFHWLNGLLLFNFTRGSTTELSYLVLN
jgi:hypothetical protein